MAKLFGYVGPPSAPAFADVVSLAIAASRAKRKLEGEIGYAMAKSPELDEAKAIQASRVELSFKEFTISRKSSNPRNQQEDGTAPMEPNTTLKTNQSSPIVLRKKGRGAKKTKSSISSLDEVMDLLENTILAPDQGLLSVTTGLKKKFMAYPTVREEGKAVKVGKSSLSSLDEMIRSLQQEWDLTPSDRKTSTLDQSSQHSQALPESGWNLEKTANVETNPFAYRKDSSASPANSSRPIPGYAFNTPEDLEDTQVQVQGRDREPTEKSFLEYVKEAEGMRLQRVRMDLERQRILEEELVFQEEADQFTQEEERMRRLIENLKPEEEEGNFDSQGRKRQVKGDTRGREQQGQKHFKELEDERQTIQMVERLNMENERIEKDGSGRGISQHQRETIRLRHVEEEARLKARRVEHKRITQKADQREAELEKKEERDGSESRRRLEDEETIKRQRHAEEERAKRARGVEDLRQQAAEDYWRAAKVNAEKLRQAKEEAQRVTWRQGFSRITQEARRVEKGQVERKYLECWTENSDAVAQERGKPERQGSEKDDHERKVKTPPHVFTQGRNQTPRVPQATDSETIFDRDRLGLLNQEGAGRRHNTVGGARQQQLGELGVSSGNTVGARSNMNAGGVTGGPKYAGLPSGPRPRAKLQLLK
jgi:hypothetical protein